MKKIPTITGIIKGAMARNGYTARDLSKATGIAYSTLTQQRFTDPGGWRFFEFGAVQRAVSFTPEELTQIERAMKERR